MTGPHQPGTGPSSPTPPPTDSGWPAPPPGDAWPAPAPAAAPPPSRGGANVGLVIAIIAVVGVVALALCGGVGWIAYSRYRMVTTRAADTPILGIKDYRTDAPDLLGRDHELGDIRYPMTPPAGGPHNPTWQDCTGKVYSEPIAEEMAVHSLEHGAVWITYKPGLSAGDIAKLAKKVEGRDYLMLSPYPAQDTPISLQAWGYQLKVDSVSDERIDEFITKYRKNASVEPGAPCSGGTTASGSPNADPSPSSS